MLLIDMDMPESCADCPLAKFTAPAYCVVAKKEIFDDSERLSDCPIMCKVNLDPVYLDKTIDILRLYNNEPRYEMTLCIETRKD